ncbi:hypothetical protein PV325_012170 [Microctonus aethiopoides]|nr:hypothetical protein PV325_012170 [Microctonus aethiopoides]KAK0091120.1 hypothetical protein PV326_003709 [Microctonus aethiopoides]
MSKIKNFNDDSEQQHIQTAASGDSDPVPQSLKEVLGLINSINRRLEDCAMEWQSKVSKKQWKILNNKSINKNSWDQSLLTRTYFTDKNLDEGFQKLLGQVRTFMENMNNFIALLRGERPIIILEAKKDAQNQSTEPPSSPVATNEPNEKPAVAPLDLSVFDDNKSPQCSGRRRSKRLADNSTSNIQNCFADLIKAKIDLDTKFLGFEAVLNGSSHVQAPSSEEVSCLCQMCSNVLEAVIDNEKILREVGAKSKMRRITKTTGKRLSRSAQIWKGNKEQNQSLSIAHISGNSLISSNDIANS